MKPLLLAQLLLQGCAVQKRPVPTSGSRFQLASSLTLEMNHDPRKTSSAFQLLGNLLSLVLIAVDLIEVQITIGVPAGFVDGSRVLHIFRDSWDFSEQRTNSC